MLRRNSNYEGPERREAESGWHLTRKFAFSIIGALLLNCLSGIWYASKIDSTIQQDHEAIQNLSLWREKKDDAESKMEQNIATVNQKLIDVSQRLVDQNDILKNIYQILEEPSWHQKRQ
jgi:hypothetical protein